jgi:site-specific DNA-methyltransferase (adenine-specific)
LDDAGWEVVSCIEHVHGQGWPKGRSQLKPAKEIWWLVRWGGVTPLQIDRCRVRRSESLNGGAYSKSNQENSMFGLGYTGREYEQPAGSWPPDLLLTHAPACREVGVRKVRSATGHGNSGSSILKNTTARGINTSHGGSDGTETVPAWSCLAACTCGLASLSPAGGAPERCPGCGEERWWACPVAELDGQSGTLTSGARAAGVRKGLGYHGADGDGGPAIEASEGGSSRFFPTFHYDAKASARERQAGCEGLLWVKDKAAPIGWRRVSAEEHAAAPDDSEARSKHGARSLEGVREAPRAVGNIHSTIKPIGAGEDDGLMRWLVRLITPPGGRVGDPFLGSGSTAVACQIEGHPFEGCDIDPGAVDIARARAAFWTPERHRLELVNAAALRAEEKRQEEAAARGQLDWTRGL